MANRNKKKSNQKRHSSASRTQRSVREAQAVVPEHGVVFEHDLSYQRDALTARFVGSTNNATTERSRAEQTIQRTTQPTAQRRKKKNTQSARKKQSANAIRPTQQAKKSARQSEQVASNDTVRSAGQHTSTTTSASRRTATRNKKKRRKGATYRRPPVQHTRRKKRKHKRPPLSKWRRARKKYTGRQLRAKQRRQMKIRRSATVLFSVVLTVFCVIRALTIFFTVGTIEFVGLEKYALQDVQATFGVAYGENLFFCDYRSGIERLRAHYPYFENVSISWRMPDTICVTVTETQAAAAIRSEDGGWYLIDRKARVLENTRREPTAEVPIVAGVTAPNDVQEGSALPIDSEGKIAMLCSLMEFCEAQDMIDRVGGINLSAMYDICFALDDRFAVRIGDGSDLERKMRWIDMLIQDRLGPADIAVIDLTDPAQVSTLLITQNEYVARIEGDRTGESTLVSPSKLMNQPESEPEVILDDNTEEESSDSNLDEAEKSGDSNRQ